MEARVPGDRVGMAVAIAALVGVLIGLSALLDLWPFDDEDDLSRAELIARGDEICARAHDAFEELQEKTPRTAAEAEDLTDNLIGIAEDEYDRIAALDGPEAIDRRLDTYLELRRDGIDALRDGREAAIDHEADAYRALQAEVAGGQDERLERARRIGFRECSRPLGASR